MAVQLRVRLQRAVRRHREERALEGAAASQDLVDLQLLPELPEDVDAAVRPCVEDSDVRLGRERLLPWEHPQDARRQPPELVAVELVGPAEVVDHRRDRARLLLVPLVLGELEVARHGAVAVPSLRLAEVHT